MNTPQVSVVIVSYNVKDMLRDCLHSVLQEGQTVPLELIVVDNASGDGSAQMVEHEFPQVKLIKNDENLGFAKATNQGMRQSRGEHVLLLNPDTVVYRGAISEMVRGLRENPSAGVIAPRLLNEDGSPQPSLSLRTHLSLPVNLIREFQLYRWLGGARRYLEDAQFAGSATEPREIEDASGACLLARGEAVKDVGLLDERFFFQGEDCDWCLRMKKAGWKVLYWPSAVITHLGRKSSPDVWSPTRQCNLRHARYLLMRKHRGAIAALALRAAVFWGHLLQVLVKMALPGVRSRARTDLALMNWAISPRPPRELAPANPSPRARNRRVQSPDVP